MAAIRRIHIDDVELLSGPLVEAGAFGHPSSHTSRPEPVSTDLLVARSADRIAATFNRRPWWEGAGSLAMHVTLLLLAFLQLTPHLGSGGQQLEAVSVEMITSEALESLSSQRTDSNGGNTLLSATAQDAPDARDDTATSTARFPDRKSEPETVKAQEDSTEQTRIANLERTEPDPRSTPAEARQEVTEVQVAGGADSVSASESSGAAGATASAGQIARYAMEIRLALGRARPTHRGIKGRVVIRFVVAPDGSVRMAELVESSGRAGLDDVGLQAIRNAKIPVPPPGMTEEERTYVVPFEFK